MSDDPKRAISEAQSWLAAARHTFIEAREEEAGTNVCCAQAIHSIIRANDALSLHFFNMKPTRHDDAAIVFAKLLREGKLPASAESFKSLIASAMRDKSGADYGKSSFSLAQAEKYVEDAAEFIEAARQAIGI